MAPLKDKLAINHVVTPTGPLSLMGSPRPAPLISPPSPSQTVSPAATTRSKKSRTAAASPAPATQPAGCITRGSTASTRPFTSSSTFDPPSEVQNLLQATALLEKLTYLAPGEDIDPAKLSHIVMQVTVATPGLPCPISDILQAISFLLHSLILDQSAEALASAVEKLLVEHVSDRLDNISKGLSISAKTISSCASRLADTTDKASSSLQSAVPALQKVSEDLNNLAAHVPSNFPAIAPDQPTSDPLTLMQPRPPFPLPWFLLNMQPQLLVLASLTGNSSFAPMPQIMSTHSPPCLRRP
jgi:hypothetical protein